MVSINTAKRLVKRAILSNIVSEKKISHSQSLMVL